MFERWQEAAGGLFKLVDLARKKKVRWNLSGRKKEKKLCCRSHIQQRIMRQQKQLIEAGVTHMTHLEQRDEPDEPPRTGTDHRGSR